MAVFDHAFYHQTLRKYIVAFGNMFSGMVVQRLDSSSNKIQTIAVPISYSPKEKFLARLALDPNLTRPIAVQLPAMAFEIASMAYDGTRRLSSIQQNKSAVSAQVTKTQYTPVPWNIDFTLFIFVRNADDGAQLLEQILPFFGPEWTNSINLMPSMNIVMDVPTVLTNVTTEDAYEGDFMTRRAMVYTLNFTMKGYFYGPVRSSGSRNKLIRKIQLDFSMPPGTGEVTDADVAEVGRSSRVIITPGLLANGSPTTNSAASISPSLISANSNFGIASDKYIFYDGLKYNPVTGDDE